MSEPDFAEVSSSVVGARKRADNDTLNAQLAALSEMGARELRAEWRRLYRSHPPKLLRRDLLQLGVAWKLQERVLGGLSAATKRQLDELARTMATKSDLAKARTCMSRSSTKRCGTRSTPPSLRTASSA